MATLSQFFPGGGDGLLVYSKEITWNPNNYLTLSGPQYIDNQYVTIGVDVAGNVDRAIILSQSGNYVIKLNGMSYGSGLMQLSMYLVNSANNGVLKTRTESVGANATWLTVSETNYELLKGVATNERVNLFANVSGSLYNFSFEVFKL